MMDDFKKENNGDTLTNEPVDRRDFVGRLGITVATLGAALAAPRVAGAEAECRLFGGWLAIVMNEKRIDTARLAERSGIDESRIEEILSHQVPLGETARWEMGLLGGAMLLSQGQVEAAYSALVTADDLSEWSASCDGGCCSWNSVID